MQEEDIKVLLEKYQAGTITDAEKAVLDEWYLHVAADRSETLSDEERLETFDTVLAHLNEVIYERKTRTLWPRIAAAASIIIACSVGGYFVLHQQQKQQVAVLKPGTFKNEVLPGNKAILTLGNGQQLAVTNIPTGKITNTNVQKTTTGALVYSPAEEAPDVYNTLTVPRGGGKHELKLADGTLAVLDAGSSIRFPVAFNGKDRRVTITGQVYFEVVHKASQPFFVVAGKETIEDIGTHFNVNMFDGETKTTLIEGSVKVNSLLLKPGQQAIGETLNTKVDEEEVLAWKNDLFKFGKNTSLQMVMNQLSRWYDMDVVYEGQSKTYHFGGDMPRYSKLSDVLKILAYNGVQFSVDGKKLIVYQ
ncbi:MAG: fec operon regulator FecR [Bacteroidota bacterium]|nr:fec operon regulator FecR [Bacteroidota bacterium]